MRDFARVLAVCWGAATLLAMPAVAADRYDQPWTRDDSVLVLDPYEANEIDWDKLARDPKVVGLIHRATIGLKADSRYGERAHEAQARGYLWGAYHLGRAGDPIAQADFFLKTVGNAEGVLLALDLEDVTDANNMNIADAIRFIAHVKARTGRAPVVYANRTVTFALSFDSEFAAIAPGTRLWYARYKDHFSPTDLGAWRDYFLWQFSSEENCKTDGACLYNVPGVHHDMDVNVYPGSREALAAAWSSPLAEGK